MSREEVQSEMQKFKGALIKDVERRSKLLKQAKSKTSDGIKSALVFISIVGISLAQAHFKLSVWNSFLAAISFYVLVSLIEQGRLVRRIDALIELIGEENLLKKS